MFPRRKPVGGLGSVGILVCVCEREKVRFWSVGGIWESYHHRNLTKPPNFSVSFTHHIILLSYITTNTYTSLSSLLFFNTQIVSTSILKLRKFYYQHYDKSQTIPSMHTINVHKPQTQRFYVPDIQ